MDFGAIFDKVKHDDMITECFFNLWQYSADMMFIMAVEENGEFSLYDNNPASRAIMGIDKDAEIHRLDLRDYWDDDIVKGLYQSYQKAINAQKPITVEQEAVSPDGSVTYVSTLLVPMFDEHHNPIFICGVSRNITEIKKTEQMARQAHKQAEQYNLALQKINQELDDKVEIRTAELKSEKIKAEQATMAKSDFLAKMSHEIRTPMNAVIGLSRLALRTQLNHQQQDYLEKILDAGEVLLGVINDILDFSKVEAGKLSIEKIHFKLDDLIKSTVSLSAMNAYSKGLELITDIDPDIPRELVGDKLRIQQIIVNLTNNAVKFTEKGSICIKLRIKEETEQQLVLHCSIIDTGIGMNKKQQDKIFGSFTQADESVTRKYGGTGLGLAISKQLSELMGGQIWLESEPGKGSTFHFTVSLGKYGQQTSLVVDEQALGQLRVLVVDDTGLCRKVFIELLDKMGITSDQAESGHEAIKMVKEARVNNVPYDLIFLDWRMPDMDGIETSRQIFENDVDDSARILMVSAYDKDEAQNLVDHKIISQIIEKPVNQSILLDAITQTKFKDTSKQAHSNFSRIPQLSSAHILLVDDNPINRQVALGFLNDTQVKVDIAENGLIALQKVQQFDYDLILMDIQMPEMDGLSATRKIRNDLNNQRIPIIAMTAHALEKDVVNSIEAGMNEHITKPIDPDELYHILLTYLGSHETLVLTGNELKPASTIELKENIEKAILLKLKDIKELNSEKAIQKLNYRTELYLNIIKDFTSKRNLCDELQSLFNNGDWEALHNKAHSLKSNSAYMGAYELSEVSSQFELSLDEGKQDRKLLNNICSTVKSIQEQLNLIYPENKQNTRINFSVSELKNILNQMIPLLECCNFAVDELLEPLNDLCRGTQYEQSAIAIIDNVNDFEHEQAISLSKELLKQIDTIQT